MRVHVALGLAMGSACRLIELHRRGGHLLKPDTVTLNQKGPVLRVLIRHLGIGMVQTNFGQKAGTESWRHY